MSKSTPAQPATYPDPAAVRRTLATAYKALAKGKRFTAAEQAEFNRMADRWAATLPEKN